MIHRDSLHQSSQRTSQISIRTKIDSSSYVVGRRRRSGYDAGVTGDEVKTVGRRNNRQPAQDGYKVTRFGVTKLRSVKQRHRQEFLVVGRS